MDPYWRGRNRPSAAASRHELVRTDTHYTQHQTYSYSQHHVPSGWGSYDYFPIRPSIALPPPLPPFQPPTRFLYCEEWQQVPTRFPNRLRRWGDYQSLHNASASSSATPPQHLYHTRYVPKIILRYIHAKAVQTIGTDQYHCFETYI